MRDQWLAELTWRDSGGCAHTLTHWALDPHQALDAMAMAMDVLTELMNILEDPPPPDPGEKGSLRHLWHYRAKWAVGSTEHQIQAWESNGQDAWTGLSKAMEELADVREVLKQVYGPRSPKLIGEDDDDWGASLARFDAKEQEVGRKLEDLQQTLDRLTPPE